jgi:predicted ATPase/class 3 adenylate cyclase
VRGINDLERGVRQSPRKDTVALLAQALLLTGEERTNFEAAARRGARQADPVTTTDAPAAAVLETSALSSLPTGTVTFLFTDIEGSTRLLQQLGAARYVALRDIHARLLRAASAAHGGHEVDTQGDSFFFAFPTATEAAAAAAEAQRAIAGHPWPDGATVRVRMGVHTGAPLVAGDHYVGLDVHRAARIEAAGHGGQVLLSESTHALLEPDLPHEVVLRDLGVHRLKDLQRPEHLWQLVLPDVPGLAADYPPLGILDPHSHNLPIQPTPLLGRDREVAALSALLRREDVRLVTLTGPGGTGKTRLALQVAAELVEDFADGVWFVRLSRLVDPELVIPTIAQTLGLREAGGQPIAVTLTGYLHNKHVLLVLDNFEQVAAAATALAELLATCARLKALVTSRVVLHLRGEKRYRVPPLPLPDPAHLPPPQDMVQHAAVALFVQWAQEADATFALSNATALAIAAICVRLDGLPLAIELAAAKVRVLPPATLLARLERQLPLLTGGARDVEARQQTMRNTLGWSEELLSPEHQRLFRRLAVFVGGWTLEAAEAVCAAPAGADPLGVDILEGLEALVDQSLVQPWLVDGAQGSREGDSEARFRMLYVIREYALEQLEASGEAEALRRAHGAFYLGLAEQAEPELDSAGQVGGTWRLERECDNLRAALGWLCNRGEVASGLRLALAIHTFWTTRSLFSEARAWLDRLLAMVPLSDEPSVELSGTPGRLDRMSGTGTATGVPAGLQARALAAAGYLALVQRDFGAAAVQLEAGLALGRAAGNGSAVFNALYALSEVARVQGDSEQSSARIEECLAVARDLGEPGAVGEALWMIGALAYERDEWTRAAARFEEALAVSASSTQPHLKARSLWFLGSIALQQGNPVHAISCLREALTLNLALGNQRGLAYVLEVLAWAYAMMGQSGRAGRLLGAATALREATEVTSERPRYAEELEIGVAPARAALGEAGWAAEFAAGRALSEEEAIAEALEDQE